MEVDLKKHLLYSKQIEEIVGEFIRKKLGEEAVESTLDDVREQYAIFLKDLPYLGGKKCTHNGVGGTYDCIYVFALYEVLEDKPTIEELYEMNNAVLLPSFQNMPRFVNANKPWVLRLINFVFKVTAKGDKKLREKSSGGYIMEVEPYDPKVGAKYHFDYCPLAEFARKNGYLEIMPAFCNSDYPAMEVIHAALIRKNTCANSTHCDYWIVGDQSKYTKQYPRKTD